MRILVLTLMAAVGGFWAVGARANDGFGGISATGLTFGQTDAVEMLEEDLFIGIDRIAVDYVFRNSTHADVTGEVIFPLPPIPLGETMMSDWNLPDDRQRENLLGFSVLVNGQDMPFTIDHRAVIAPPWEEGRPLSAHYDTPGTDVTEILEQFGIPLTLDVEQVTDYLHSLPDQALRAMADEGLIFLADQGGPEDIIPNWSVIYRYHWTQTFPAGQEVRVSHSYENRPWGGIFIWRNPPEDDWLQELTARYCIDQGTSAAIMKRLKNSSSSGEGYVTGMSWNIAYVLRTANSWAGPIGRFRLTLDKGSTSNVISLCASGVKKTGPTTFVVEKSNFTPESDLEILVVQPLGN